LRHQCGQILETLKGNTAKLCKLQILTLAASGGQKFRFVAADAPNHPPGTD
jgi:hypothetical protein